MTRAAGTPVARIIKPKILKVQAGPTLLISPSIARVRAVPPKPPAAYINPIAKPRFLLKYCAGMIDTIMRDILSESYQYMSNSIHSMHRTNLVPRPINTPLVKKSPPMLSVQKPLRTAPPPRHVTATKAAYLVPTNLMNLAFANARILQKVTDREPMKERL
jgi:hypothetical protein